MSYHTYVPAPPLDAFVKWFWLMDGYHPSHEKERVLPTGDMQLIINLREDVIRVYDRQDPDQFDCLSGSVLAGVYSAYGVIDTACQAATIGVHFKPGGAFPFLGRPASELQDTDVSLDTLWGRAAADELRGQLLEPATPKAKFRILEQALLARVAPALERHPAVAFALKEFMDVPMRTVASVTGQIGLSHRRFIQVFHEEVGLTPKLFCRIRRFQEVLGHIEDAQQVDWTDIALACGYYDQAHFIRDFQAFSGINPTIYLARRSEYRNHVPLPA